MTELRKLFIEGPVGKLECLLRLHPNPRATAVIAHPHPMHGGTMDNAVIFHSDRELHRAGFTTMRFNFRNAGKSEGIHRGWGQSLRDDVSVVERGVRDG